MQPSHHGSLQQLPSGLLQHIWELLKARNVRTDFACNNQHQHALYSTCKAVRHDASKFISRLDMKLDMARRSADAAIDDGIQCLDRFPSQAILTSLSIQLVLPPGNGNTCSLLPDFMSEAGPRLHAVHTLALDGANMVYSCGDTWSIAAACPGLVHLKFNGFKASTPVFAPLAQLAALKQLTLSHMVQPLGSRVMASLAGLSQLEVLKIGAVKGDDAACVQHVLPHLHGLASLRSLNLWLSPGRGPLALFSSVQGLAHLTHITWDSRTWEEGLQKVEGTCMTALAHMTQLVSLALPWASLDDSAIQLLAAMPKLKELHAGEMCPTSDLNMQGSAAHPCCWEKLRLDCTPSPSELLLLPLSQVRELTVDSVSNVTWNLKEDNLTPHVLQAAAALLVPRWNPISWVYRRRYLCLCLVSGAAEGDPSRLRPALLGGLQPMQAIFDLIVSLEGWQIDASEVRALFSALPRLSSLGLENCRVTHLGFAALSAAASLRFLEIDRTIMPAPDIITGLLLGRCFAGLRLEVRWHGLSRKQLERYNAPLVAHGAETGKVVEVVTGE